MIKCPECPPYAQKNPQLDIVVYNYSGCGVDHAICENCGKK